MGYESGLANFYQRLSQKKEFEGFAVPATVSISGISGADEWGTLAARWRAGVVDASGNGLTQVSREGRSFWR